MCSAPIQIISPSFLGKRSIIDDNKNKNKNTANNTAYTYVIVKLKVKDLAKKNNVKSQRNKKKY